jgi:hypothetical protein
VAGEAGKMAGSGASKSAETACQDGKFSLFFASRECQNELDKHVTLPAKKNTQFAETQASRGKKKINNVDIMLKSCLTFALNRDVHPSSSPISSSL